MGTRLQRQDPRERGLRRRRADVRRRRRSPAHQAIRARVGHWYGGRHRLERTRGDAHVHRGAAKPPPARRRRRRTRILRPRDPDVAVQAGRARVRVRPDRVRGAHRDLQGIGPRAGHGARRRAADLSRGDGRHQPPEQRRLAVGLTRIRSAAEHNRAGARDRREAHPDLCRGLPARQRPRPCRAGVWVRRRELPAQHRE